MTVPLNEYELITDPNTGAKSIKVVKHNRSTIIVPKEFIHSFNTYETYDQSDPNETTLSITIAIGYNESSKATFEVAIPDVPKIAKFLFGITDHFYSSIRVFDVPGLPKHYSFISTGGDVRIISSSDIHGWTFKDTTADNIHNLCIDYGHGHSLVVVCGAVVYGAWETAHLGRYSYQYINYDGSVTESPVYPPEEPQE